jgi:uncharacterized protein (TIGR04255 family)
MAHQYRKPPILEATFECRFEPSARWGLSSLAELQERLREEYPAEPAQLASSDLQLASEAGEFKASFRTQPQSQVFQFASTDGTALVRAGRELVSVHATGPYVGWRIFRDRIAGALQAYVEIAQPSIVQRYSIRYVNRIDLPPAILELTDYFRVPLGPPEGLGFSLSTFFLRLEAARPDQTRIIQTFASVPAETISIILDLDVVREAVNEPAVFSEQLMRRIDDLREIERDAFEASITDKLREVFDADNG